MALLKSMLVGHFLNSSLLPSQFLCQNKPPAIFKIVHIFTSMERITGFKLLPLTFCLSTSPLLKRLLLYIHLENKNRNLKISKLLWWRKERTDMEGANRTFREKPDEFLEVT